jgi:FdhD protein
MPYVAVEETPWWLEVNGRRVLAGTGTPDRLQELALGRLAAEGFIASPADVTAFDVAADPIGVVVLRVRVPLDRERSALAEAEHRARAGCGLLHFLSCDRNALLRARRLPPPPLGTVGSLLREMFDATRAAHPDGGMHAAALTDGRVLLRQVEDVGRHNAVDKAVGAAFLAGEDPADLGLLLSARLSAGMAAKAARAGLAWVATRSLPTTLALALAEAAGLPVVARAAGRDPILLGGRLAARGVT